MVAALEKKVVDAGTSLPEKYRVLFSLRNVAGAAATKALITGSRTAGTVCLYLNTGSLSCVVLWCAWMLVRQ